jgi:hypothetical protein
MYDHNDEYHHCPQCRRRTRHRVSRGERKLADVLWCQTCYHVHMGTQAETSAVRPTHHHEAERAA